MIDSMISLASFAFCKTLIDKAPKVGSPKAEKPIFSKTIFWLVFLLESRKAESEHAVKRMDLTDSIMG